MCTWWRRAGLLNAVPRADGTLVNSATPIDIEFGSGPRMAVDSQGRLFVGNGSFGTGEMYSFNADLTPRWNVAVPNINIGGPAIGEDGTLVLAGVGTNIRAYRTTALAADFDGDGFVTGIDFDLYVAAFEAGDLSADFDGDGFITGIDSICTSRRTRRGAEGAAKAGVRGPRQVHGLFHFRPAVLPPGPHHEQHLALGELVPGLERVLAAENDQVVERRIGRGSAVPRFPLPGHPGRQNR